MSVMEKSLEAGSTTDTDQEKHVSEAEAQDDIENDDSQYLSGIRLGVLLVGLCLAIFLMGLDNSIIATAIPTITTYFDSLEDVGWYASAYLICVCTLQPISAKIFQYFTLKWTYLLYIAMFELGSLICATAVSSLMLIIGRAIAGIGGAGLFSGGLVMIAQSVALRQRPLFTAIAASMFGIANVLGPILGGVFTQHVSWRWCFYINLPFGVVAALTIATTFKPKPNPKTALPLREKLKHLDLGGLAIFIPAVVMLLLAVQWGGNKFAWKSATIIGLLVGFAVMIVIFGFSQWYQKDEASIPFSVMGQRSVYSAAILVFTGLGAVSIMAFYLPMWFQVVKDSTPLESGIRFLPNVAGNVFMGVIAGGLITKFGHFNPWLFAGGIMMAVAGGVFSTWTIHTNDAMINGIQILGGAGSSLVIQTPIIGLMSVLPPSQLPIGTSIAVFFQFLGGSIFLAISSNILNSRLTTALATYAPTVNATMVIAAGAEGLRKVVTDKTELEGAVLAYNVAITGTFYLCAAGAAVAFLAAFGMEWRSFKLEERKNMDRDVKESEQEAAVVAGEETIKEEKV